MKTFINVAQMKLATLQAGQFVETGGYYVKGDAGAAKYLVVTAQAADEYGDHTLANGTVALLQINSGRFLVSQFGARNGVDSTLQVKAAANATSTDGKFVFDVVGECVFTSVTFDNKTDIEIVGSSGCYINGEIYIHNFSGVKTKDLNIKQSGKVVSGRHGISLANGVNYTSQSDTFQGCDSCVYVEPVDSFQHVRRVTIHDTKTSPVDSDLYTSAEINDFPSIYYSDRFPNYLLYCDHTVPSNPEVLQTGDFSVLSCNPVLVSVSHIHALGLDGLICSGNTFFMPSYYYRSQRKKHNIYLNKTTWVIIDSNDLFEAGLQSIKIERGSNITIGNNEIAWPGQRDFTQGDGVLLSLDPNDTFSNFKVTGTSIRLPSGSCVKLSGACNYATISSVNCIIPGSSNVYYGDGTNPAGPTALPAITGTYYGVDVPQECSQVTVGDISCTGTHSLPKSISTFNSTQARKNGPHMSNVGSNTGKFEKTNVATLTDISTGSIDVSNYAFITVNDASGGSVTDLLNGNNGEEVAIYNTSTGFTIVNDSTKIRCYGQANILVGFRDTVKFRLLSDIWYQV